MDPKKAKAIKDATRVYKKSGFTAHLIRNHEGGSKVAVCGAFSNDWLGTGSQDEYDRASVMRTCQKCLATI